MEVKDEHYLYLGIYFFACAVVAIVAWIFRDPLRSMDVGKMAIWCMILLAPRLGWLMGKIEQKQEEQNQST
jgi:hypothetical protein